MAESRERLGIPDYIRMIKEDKDFFKASASVMLDKPYKEVTIQERTLVKRFLLWALCSSKGTLELLLSDELGKGE